MFFSESISKMKREREREVGGKSTHRRGPSDRKQGAKYF